MLDITRFLSTIFPFQLLLILKNSEKPILKLVISYKKGNVSKEWRNFAEDRRRSAIKVNLLHSLARKFPRLLVAKYLQIAHAAVQVLALLAEVEVEAIAESNLVLPRAESHA